MARRALFALLCLLAPASAQAARLFSSTTLVAHSRLAKHRRRRSQPRRPRRRAVDGRDRVSLSTGGGSFAPYVVSSATADQFVASPTSATAADWRHARARSLRRVRPLRDDGLGRCPCSGWTFRRRATSTSTAGRLVRAGDDARGRANRNRRSADRPSSRIQSQARVRDVTGSAVDLVSARRASPSTGNGTARWAGRTNLGNSFVCSHRSTMPGLDLVRAGALGGARNGGSETASRHRLLVSFGPHLTATARRHPRNEPSAGRLAGDGRRFGRAFAATVVFVRVALGDVDGNRTVVDRSSRSR
jgi:hypothetical protein